MGLPPQDKEARIPHAHPVRMIERLDFVEGKSCGATIKVPQDSPYLVDGKLCPEFLLDIMAQCFAVASAYHGHRGDGYLAAVKDFEVNEPVYRGDILNIQCELNCRVGNIWVIDGLINKFKSNGEFAKIASANFKLFIEGV